jgi:hypothetical protein
METTSPVQDDPSFSERATLARALKKLRLAAALGAEQYEAAMFRFGLKPDLRAWGLFFKRVFSLLGLLLFMIGLGMFLAWNWAAMPKFLKFALFELVFVLCSCLAVWRWKKESSAHWLLGAGLGIGLLLALHGQIYQTGANAWELFRLWALALLPLFLLKRTAALGMLLWLTLSLWVYLYSFGGRLYHSDRFFFLSHGDMLLYQQAACWLFCEILHQLSIWLKWKIFDPGRWLTRFTGFTTLALLTLQVSLLLFMPAFSYDAPLFEPVIHSRTLYMYLAFLAVTYILYYKLYYKKKPDFFFLSIAVFSVAVILSALFLRFVSTARMDESGLLFCGVLVMAVFIAAGLLLMKVRGRLLQAGGNAALSGRAAAGEAGGPEADKVSSLLRQWLRENSEAQDSLVSDALREAALAEAKVQPWYLKLPMALGIWFGSILAVIFIMLMSGGMPPLAPGLAFVACGVWPFRKESFAWRQFGLALIACGLVMCGIGLMNDLPDGMLVFALIFLGLWAAVKYPSAGIICMAAALACFLAFWEYSLFGYGGGLWFAEDTDLQQLVLITGIAYTFLFAAALAFSLAVLGTARKKIDPVARLLESAAGGALLFVMFAAVVRDCLPPDVQNHFFPSIVLVRYGLPLGILCGFAFFLFMNIRGVFSRAVWVPAGLFLAAISHFSPVSALGLLLLFFARNRGDAVLAGFAAVYLAAGISFYYYNIHFPFVQKAVIMMSCGAALLALAAVSGALLPVFAARKDRYEPC